MANKSLRDFALRQDDKWLQQAILYLGEIHAVQSGAERYDRNSSGFVLLDRLCYYSHRLGRIPATTRASAHYLLESDLGIKVDIDLENLPCHERR